LSKLVLKSLENVKPGRLIAIDWWDASVGKGSSSDMAIDVLIKSASGIFVGQLAVEQSTLRALLTLEF
jgi:hypothetical protein